MTHKEMENQILDFLTKMPNTPIPYAYVENKVSEQNSYQVFLVHISDATTRLLDAGFIRISYARNRRNGEDPRQYLLYAGLLELTFKGLWAWHISKK